MYGAPRPFYARSSDFTSIALFWLLLFLHRKGIGSDIMFLLCFVFVLLDLLWFYGLLFLCSLFADDAFLALSPDIMSARNHCGRLPPLVSYLQQLYWLPISETPCLSYIAITGSAPSYLSELLPLQFFRLSPLFVRQTHTETPTLQPQNPWISHFLTLWPPHLKQSPPRNQALC